ncbi:MAG: ATP-dependent metallopeptidase FtsH/Yme1/Tma family protein, partial [Bombella apis]|nr:ATP-dependent metallopeptidase FtsH/Yme1/Tma family protein [Bombella apis]
MNNIGRNVAIWVVIVLAAIGVLAAFQPGSHQVTQKIAYSDFVHDVEGHEVRSVNIQDQYISGVLTNGTAFETYAPEDPMLVPRLTSAGVQVTAHPSQSDDNSGWRYIMAYLPILLLLGLGFMLFR